MKKSFLFLFSLLGLAFANAQEVDMSKPLVVTEDCDSIEVRGLLGYTYLKIEDSDKPLVINYFQSFRELNPQDHTETKFLPEGFSWPTWGETPYTPMTLTNDELYIGRNLIFERDYRKYSFGWYISYETSWEIETKPWPDAGVYENKNNLVFTNNWFNVNKIKKLTFGPNVTRLPEYHNYSWKREHLGEEYYEYSDAARYSYFPVHNDYITYGGIPFVLPPDNNVLINDRNGNPYEFDAVRIEGERFYYIDGVDVAFRTKKLEIGSNCKSLAGIYFDTNTIICEASTPPELTAPLCGNMYSSYKSVVVVPDGTLDAYKKAGYWRQCYNIVEATDYAASIAETDNCADCDMNISQGRLNISCESIDKHPSEIFMPDGTLIYRGNAGQIDVPKGLIIIRHADRVEKLIN